MRKKVLQKTVLLVDDDEDILNILCFAFKKEGLKVVTFLNGTEAVQYLTNQEGLSNPHLLILDRILPDMDGTEIPKKLKEKKHQLPPYFFLSVLSSTKDVEEGLRLGAKEYITKPFNIKELTEKVLKHLNL